jgi:glutamate synthase domain-containing protein 2
MIEIKLSQRAKPGHSGVLPGAKVSAEIAGARGVPIGVDCISPARHSAFRNPIEMMHFIAQMRDLSGGKPVGFKLCIGNNWEFMALCKAMRETKIHPDFIVIDGSEGGTAQHRSNSSITSARRCARVSCSPTISWWEQGCAHPCAWARAGG